MSTLKQRMRMIMMTDLMTDYTIGQELTEKL